MFGVDAPPDFRLHGRARRDVGAVRAHHFAAERLLLVRALDHEHAALEPEKRARHRKRRSPLAGSGFGGDAIKPFLLGVIRLGDRAVELVRTGSVVAFELVENLRRSPERTFKKVGADERRGTVHPVEIADLAGNFNVAVRFIQFLTDAFAAENLFKFRRSHRLERLRIEHRRGLLGHIRADVVPCLGQFIFAEIRLVRHFVHITYLWTLFP